MEPNLDIMGIKDVSEGYAEAKLKFHNNENIWVSQSMTINIMFHFDCIKHIIIENKKSFSKSPKTNNCFSPFLKLFLGHQVSADFVFSKMNSINLRGTSRHLP